MHLTSSICPGTLFHERLSPVLHRFTYPFYFYAVDVDRLPDLDREVAGFGYNRLRPVALHDCDYLRGETAPIADRVRAEFARHGLAGGISRIMLVTSARYFNYVFNPVSFYLALGPQDELIGVAAEVNNTFGDRHLYVLTALEAYDGGWRSSAPERKAFHVSPFNDLRGQYEFFFRWRNGTLDIAVDLVRDGQRLLHARMHGRCLPLTSRTLWSTLARYPLAAAMTMARILRQAATLYLRKRLPFHARPEPASALTIMRRPPGAFERLALKLVLRVLRQVRRGCIVFRFPDGREIPCGDPAAGEKEVIQVRRYRLFTRILLRGDTGFGEAYTDGDFDCDNLTRAIEILADNREVLPSARLASTKWGSILDRLFHLRRRNTRRNSRRNIRDHYDLSNDFYRLWLDDSLLYSCACYGSPDESLEDAQYRKLNRVLELARIQAHHHVLEIGSGWGGFAVHAALRTGCRVTTVTISEEQYKLARERVREAGLEDRVDVRLCDYRDLEGTFDRIVSIEMIEAVGHEFLGSFFARCESLLAPDGLMFLQVITFPDHDYERYRRTTDWIQRHVFPGGHLPSLTALCEAMRDHSRLQVESMENIGPCYAQTIRDWRARFLANWDRIQSLGFDDTFRRKWLYYFSYCEAGFSRRILGNLHLVITRPENPDLRSWIASRQESRTRVQGVTQGTATGACSTWGAGV